MSNLSFICFSLSRLFLAETSSTSSNAFTVKFMKLNVNKLYLILFVLCTTWSTFKIFEYRINKSFGMENETFPFNSFEIVFCVYDPYFSVKHVIEREFFQTMNMINNTLNNIFIFFN